MSAPTTPASTAPASAAPASTAWGPKAPRLVTATTPAPDVTRVRLTEQVDAAL